MKGRVAEVFESVQGEGLYLGEKQVFVRLFGCNLSCRFCDTKLDCFMEYFPQELADEIALHSEDVHSISFTGGEPLMQTDFLKEVFKELKKQGKAIYLETNGTLHRELESVIDFVSIVAMDIKLPSSTGLTHFWHEHERFLAVARKKEVFAKAIICQDTSISDIGAACSLIRKTHPGAVLVLQPDSSGDQAVIEEKISEFKTICQSHGVCSCVIPQMHKIAGIK